MRTKTTLWLLIAASLVLIGCILFTVVMRRLGWDFTKLSTVKYETNTYTIREAFDSISIHTDTADIIFKLSNDETCRVVCYEEENVKHSVAVKDGALTVEWMDTRSVSDYVRYIGINFGSPKITVYLPKTEYASLLVDGNTCDVEIPKNFTFGDVDISTDTGDVVCNASVSALLTVKTGTGDIRLEAMSVGALDLSVSTGDIQLSDMHCKNLTASGNTSDITLDNVIATETILIQTGTGDVTFDGCDAAEISVKTRTGDVMGSLLTDKVFIAEASTGKISVPKTTTGGRCQITTDTGDIRITIAQP